MAEAITSPDQKVQILCHSIAWPPKGPLSIQGNIKNISSSAVSVERENEFYDESGKLIGTSAGIIKDLALYETRIFEILWERGPDMWQVKGHKIVSENTVS